MSKVRMDWEMFAFYLEESGVFYSLFDTLSFVLSLDQIDVPLFVIDISSSNV